MFALKYAEVGIPIFPISGTARKPDGKFAKKPLVKARARPTRKPLSTGGGNGRTR
jgi:hypothetical protein